MFSVNFQTGGSYCCVVGSQYSDIRLLVPKGIKKKYNCIDRMTEKLSNEY